MSQPAQHQDVPGVQSEMRPRPDCGEESYRGHDRLAGKAAVITGGDSGIGRPVAIAFAREGADVLIFYLEEDDDARDTARLVEEPHGPDQPLGLVPSEQGGRAAHGPRIVDHRQLVGELGHAEPEPGAVRRHQGGDRNLTVSLAQMLGERGLRANSVAPGPIWTPLIPSTMPEEAVEKFGSNTPLGRPGQPAELAPVYVLPASDEGSYVSGARIAVTGGRPIL